MYFVLGAQFQSFLEPFILFLSLPFAGFGIVIFLSLSGKALDIHASLGILVLIGIAVNNSIVLFDTYKKNRQKGMIPITAVLFGSVRRIKPIMMTMLTTVAALIPLAIDPNNRSNQSGMAVAILGGLIVSTICTAILQPYIFLCYFRKKYA
jgi:HAE1 family hydrophobic/amphiphilic exporter-1